MDKQNDKDEIKDDAEQEILDFNRPDFKFQPKEHHDWRQQGPYLVCKSCEIEHASWIGMDKLLVGLNSEGQPILKDRSKV